MANRLLIALFIITFTPFSNILSELKTKEFKNVIVQDLIHGRTLVIDENAFIIGNLIVQGQVVGPSVNNNVQGPTTSVPNSIALFADATGKVLKDSSVTVDGSGNIQIQGITKNGNTVSWPSTIGGSGTFLGSDGAGNLIFATPAGAGNVTTDNAFTTDNALIRVDLPSGSNNIQESNVILDDSDNMTGINQLTANTVNASLNGNATTATTATNFSGSLAGDVSGTQTATVVDTVGGQTAADIATATIAANAATSSNTANTIVRRDASGNFSAGTITASLTGAASLNVLKAGDTMTGALKLPAGDASSPTLNFTGSTNTGFSAPIADVISISTGGIERMRISEAAIIALSKFLFQNVQCDQAIQSVKPTDGGSVIVAETTSILFMTHTANITNFTVTFPSNPSSGLNNGHMFTIMLATTKTITLINDGAGATVVNEITALDPTAFAANLGGTAVTYIYDQPNNTWFRLRRG